MEQQKSIPLSKRLKALANPKELEANEETARLQEVQEEFENRISSVANKIIELLREQSVTVAEWNHIDALIVKLVNKKVESLEIDKLITLG